MEILNRPVKKRQLEEDEGEEQGEDEAEQVRFRQIGLLPT